MNKIKQSIDNLSKNQKILILSVFLLVITSLALASVFGVFSSEPEEPPEPPEPTYSQLTGIEVEPNVAERPVLGIIVENSTFARPQSGVDAAGIVFESVAEGGITRYLALYQEDMPQEVGPVRSVRPYFVGWLMGFDASIAHVGGSAPALELLDQRNAKTLNQFEYPEPYYRRSDRQAPHNMYAKVDELRRLQEELGHNTSKFDALPRSADRPAQNPEAATVNIDYSSPNYAVEFRYDKATNSYLRFLAGEPDSDSATNQQISVKNLIVAKMPGDSVEAIGSGEALVFKNGNVLRASWEQSSYQERIIITDQEGREVPLNRGSSWFAILPGTGSVSY